MTLLDRFRSVSANKHPDSDVRLSYIEALSIDEREQLASVAREDESPRVRRAAVSKLMDPTVLATVSRDDVDAGVRAAAVAMLRDIALEAFEETGEAESLAAVEALTDLKILAHVAKSTTRESVARLALGRIADVRMLGSIARHAPLESIRRAAFEGLTDAGETGEIVSIAMSSEFKDTAVAAVERLEGRDELEQVAAGSANRHAVKRARGLLRELDERAALEADAAAAAVDAKTAEVEARRRIVERLEVALTLESLDGCEQALIDAEAHGPFTSGDPASEGDATVQRFSAVVAALRERLDRARALEAERVRAQAEADRERAERQAAEQAIALAAAEEHAGKEADKRRLRFGELAADLEAAAGNPDLVAAKRTALLAQREWHDLLKTGAADPDLAERYARAEARLVEREAQAKEADAKLRRDALNRARQLLARVEPLVSARDLTGKAAERALRDIRSALAADVAMPSKQDSEEMTRRLKAAQSALMPRLQELRVIEDWQRWANVGIQEALCEKMEALKANENAEEVVRRIRDLQQQWRQAADVPRAQGEILWRRFKAAHDEIWARCEAHFAADAQRRAENLAKKSALCARVEALAESTSWIQTADEIKKLQTEWKTIGPVSRGHEKAIWERFRSACDRFFTRRHDDLVKRKATWAANLSRKEALCVKAEAIAESTDWDAGVPEIKRLQAEWKTIGAVKKTKSDAIWTRFRTACDRFFTRYAQRHEIARSERVALREAICSELEALVAPPVASAAEPPEVGVESAGAPDEIQPPTDLLATVRQLRARWQQEHALRGVDPARAVILDNRFAAAFAAVVSRWPQAFNGTDLDPEANRKRMEALVQRIESLATSLGGPVAADSDEALSPTTRLAALLKEALASNTIGGKVDDENRWRAAQEDVRQAQASWSRIGPVPDAALRPLLDRFQRACRRILERPAKPRFS